MAYDLNRTFSPVTVRAAGIPYQGIRRATDSCWKLPSSRMRVGGVQCDKALRKFDFYQIHRPSALIESGSAPRLIGPQPRSPLVAPDIPIPRTPCPGPRVAASDHCAA